MCGIAGTIKISSKLDRKKITSTLELMKNRGPDSSNFIQRECEKAQVSLLHSRLSIIDLNKRADQPFIFNNYAIIFNGEIYNYKELRKELEIYFKFETESDTEVLIKSYIKYGKSCVNKFIGMWAFVIIDFNKREVFISRDPFGEKPFYFFLDNKSFYFGSEIKYILNLTNKKLKINEKKINNYLFNGYKSVHKNEETFFNKVYSLEPSTNIELDFELNFKKNKYWIPKINILNTNKNFCLAECYERADFLIKKSLKYRMISDVPVAFCLSGGIDSSYLASIASKTFNQDISTFSLVDSDERYNEIENINSTVEDIKCNSQIVFFDKDKKYFFENIDKQVKYHDSPISTLSYYIHNFLTKKISDFKFKVSISGVGCDELFTGYYAHFLQDFASTEDNKILDEKINAWKKFILPKLRNKGLTNPMHYIDNPNDRKLIYEENFNLKKYSVQPNQITNFNERNFCKDLLRNRMLNELFYEVIPPILKHDDLNSMYYSIENRSPFLDRELFEFALSIPTEHLIKNGYQKNIIRNASVKTLNDKVRLDRNKKGFNASINSLIDFKVQENLDSIFDIHSPASEFVNLSKLKQETKFDNIPNHLSKFIFSILNTNSFIKNFS